MFCAHCGEANQTGQFCSQCGVVLTSAPSMTMPSYQNASVGVQVNPPGPSTQTSTSSGFSTASIILGAAAFLVLPWLLGTLGIVFGAIAISRKQPRAAVGLTLSIIGFVLGSIVGYFIGLGT